MASSAADLVILFILRSVFVGAFAVEDVSKAVPTKPIDPDSQGDCYKTTTEKPENVDWWTWKQGSEQRCTSVYVPPDAKTPMPVMMEFAAATQDQRVAESFGRFPVANFILSTPTGAWEAGNDGVVNDAEPQSCGDSDTKEIGYVKHVFGLIDSDERFDGTKIYTYGFAHNAIFSAYMGFCFTEKVAGIIQGGLGMVMQSRGGRAPPNKGGHCKYSEYMKKGNDCKRCSEKECKYFPIYPCYSQSKLTYCGFTHPHALLDHTMLPMYERVAHEGFDARFVRLREGSNVGFANDKEWYAGCLGITPACDNKKCGEPFKKCMEASSVNSEIAYVDCIAALPKNCTGCSPTRSMLELGEKPDLMYLSRDEFGASDLKEGARPAKSCCEHGKPGSGTCLFEDKLSKPITKNAAELYNGAMLRCLKAANKNNTRVRGCHMGVYRADEDGKIEHTHAYDWRGRELTEEDE